MKTADLQQRRGRRAGRGGGATAILRPDLTQMVCTTFLRDEAELAAGPPGYRWPDTLTSYRTMELNHETGHWLGLGHRFCGAPGAVASVMQQQSVSLQGCRANALPLPAETAAVAAPRRL